MSEFYVIATPIGNLEDITLRAVRILKEVDMVLCEDTRETKKILDRYEIEKPTLSYHSQSGEFKEEKILDLIREGKTLALVSDAGVPTISDPGSRLIWRIRKEFREEIRIVSIPGASALTAALSISGFPSSDFLFLGFLPHKKGRQTLFSEIADSQRTVVLYESPHRIEKTIESLIEAAPDRLVALGRELTKIYEEMIIGRPHEIKEVLKQNPQKIRGEFVVLIAPPGYLEK